jgi:ABC-type branched-subunit amino acid transport system substrate-binding protein
MALFLMLQRRRRVTALTALALLSSSLGGCRKVAIEQPAAPPRKTDHPPAPRLEATTPLPPGAPIVLGQSAPLSGPSASLGREYGSGALSLFRQVNARGGVFGRPIRLIQLDDRYEPARTQANVSRLIEHNGVFALFGTVGTPTTRTVLPLVERRGIPLIAPMSGAALLRQPGQRQVFHLRASYADEAERIVDYLARAGWTRVALVTQNDTFGSDVGGSLRDSLSRRGITPVTTARVERNSSRTGSQAEQVARSRPDAVVVISTYGTVASLVDELHRRRSHPQVMTVSFVGTKALLQALPRGQANGIGVTQVVPFPWDGRVPVVRDYQRAMRAGSPDARLDYTSLEGYMAARVVVEALRRAGPQLSRARFVQGLESLNPHDLGGFAVRFAPNKRSGGRFVDLTFLGAHAWEP